MKFSRIALSFLSISYLLLASCSSQAQTKTQKPITSKKQSVADWSKFARTESEFMQGCVGQKAEQASRQKIKQSFCQCAFNSYKNRYTPQQFTLINNVASQIGQNGPVLVNLMMRPELDRCSAQTNYHP
jgi:hypothetical protein